MKINIITVGKIKEKYLKEAIDEYKKRLSKFCNLNIIEISESVAKVENGSNIKKSLEDEAHSIFSKIKGEYVIALDIDGKGCSTIELSEMIKKVTLKGISELSFIIGGSYGLDNSIKKRADFRLSFSKLTFPHQLFRVILLEQIYRVFKIINNEPYHK
ncbi:MAG: 23S rRNA (pseudouridine(1915)-N(3))-methyltransferase RlmH [Lachnospiraceae bacterium]|nr:23S rRNA (pseudouridine(1915)-N(3))-methyltransferase RlmH [Lachnospiraceae bacterium]